VVHGGGPDITAYMRELGLPVEFVGGLRVSDEKTVEVAKMVLVGKVNKDIVLRLSRHGQPAVGLSGDDGRLFQCERMPGPDGEDIGYVGRIAKVNVDVLRTSPGLHPRHRVRGRRPRRALLQRQRRRGRGRRRRGAARLQGHVPHGRRGLAARRGDPGTLVSEASADDVESALGSVSGGMRPKLRACVDAIHGGVSFAHIVDGRQPHSLLLELFTDAGIGTKIRAAS
jgi:acetylglutamate kinase